MTTAAEEQDRDPTREEIWAAMTPAQRLSFEVAEEFAEAQEHWGEQAVKGNGVHVIGRQRRIVDQNWKECPDCRTWFDANACGYVTVPEKVYCSETCENRAGSRERMRRMRANVTGACAEIKSTAACEAAA